ncbi:MAG: hypothetical protein GFH27_549283n122 [Chloroflexi bacterium AL-W]|nr:hypothetical protein [Chloroflexi bacterium AL-N1]NOK64757.1 hypothetical protein [Chloroflexi bacterium AL-N10]NOK75998.1 hypothetical protein [Chloroflexi bacterium AL-N5]NOK80243.1 hypothetical protein [Chloroflexi bacterium AL-W]NOK86756.1 hypothetical protein [Chloroflexi bacterium AL-N15]
MVYFDGDIDHISTDPVRILLIEDDGSTADIIQVAMRSLGFPYKLDVAYSAEEGLQLWRYQPYNLLLTDYNLRGMTGLAVIQQLQSEGMNGPIVFFTAYDGVDVRRAAKQLGVSAYITKPFFVDQFVKTVRGLLPTQADEYGA